MVQTHLIMCVFVNLDVFFLICRSEGMLRLYRLCLDCRIRHFTYFTSCCCCLISLLKINEIIVVLAFKTLSFSLKRRLCILTSGFHPDARGSFAKSWAHISVALQSGRQLVCVKGPDFCSLGLKRSPCGINLLFFLHDILTKSQNRPWKLVLKLNLLLMMYFKICRCCSFSLLPEAQEPHRSPTPKRAQLNKGVFCFILSFFIYLFPIWYAELSLQEAK